MLFLRRFIAGFGAAQPLPSGLCPRTVAVEFQIGPPVLPGLVAAIKSVKQVAHVPVRIWVLRMQVQRNPKGVNGGRVRL